MFCPDEMILKLKYDRAVAEECMFGEGGWLFQAKLTPLSQKQEKLILVGGI